MSVSIKDLFTHQVFIGHRTDRWNPKMKAYIYGKQDGIHIFDLNKTAECLEKAQKFLHTVKEQGGSVLFVGTKPQTSVVLKELVEGTKHHYIDEKWAPGLLTNFQELRKRIDYYLNLKSQFDTGEIKKYTKKEVAQFKKELEKLGGAYHGVAEMRKRPMTLIVLDGVGNRLAVEEAKNCNIGIVGIIDSNADPDELIIQFQEMTIL